MEKTFWHPGESYAENSSGEGEVSITFEKPKVHNSFAIAISRRDVRLRSKDDNRQLKM